MDNERRLKLMQTIKGFNKKNKSQVFTLGSDIEEMELIPSGVKAFDDFIGGGFKRGAHTIVYGAYSVGKTALVLTTIANAQRDGKIVCFVNTEKPIDPSRFEFFGIDLAQMLYIEAPENAELALEGLRTLAKDKVIDLFVIDSTNGLCPKSVQETAKGSERGLEKKNVASLPMTLSNFYNVVNSLIFKSKASVVWIGQTRTKGIGSFFAHQGLTGGNAQEFYAFQIIYLRRGEKSNWPIAKIKEYWLDDNEKLRYKTIDEHVGFSVVAKLTKTNSSKSVKENCTMEIPYYHETGFHPLPDREVTIQIKGTDEEKLIIEDMLIEKGILPTDNIKQERVNDSIVENEENTLLKDKLENNKPKKRGRGRPKKNG